MKSAAIRKLNVNGANSSSKEQPQLEEFYKQIPEGQEFVKTKEQVPQQTTDNVEAAKNLTKEDKPENTNELNTTTVVDGKMVAEQNGIIDGADEQMLGGAEDNDKLTDKQGEVKFVKGGDHQNGDAKIDIAAVNGKPQSEIELHRKRRAKYRKSLQFIKKLSMRDPASLTNRDRALRRKHMSAVRYYERQERAKNAPKRNVNVALQNKVTTPQSDENVVAIVHTEVPIIDISSDDDEYVAEGPTTSSAAHISASKSDVKNGTYKSDNASCAAVKPTTSEAAQIAVPRSNVNVVTAQTQATTGTYLYDNDGNVADMPTTSKAAPMIVAPSNENVAAVQTQVTTIYISDDDEYAGDRQTNSNAAQLSAAKSAVNKPANSIKSLNQYAAQYKSYTRSLKYITKHEGRDPDSLTPAEKTMLKRQVRNVRKYAKVFGEENKVAGNDVATTNMPKTLEKYSPYMSGTNVSKPNSIFAIPTKVTVYRENAGGRTSTSRPTQISSSNSNVNVTTTTSKATKPKNLRALNCKQKCMLYLKSQSSFTELKDRDPASLKTREKDLHVPKPNLIVARGQTKVSGNNKVYSAERPTTSNETQQQSQDELKRKIKAIIEYSLCMIRKMNKRDPASLTTRDKLFKEKHAAQVRKFRQLLYGSDIDRNAAEQLITSVTAQMPTLSGPVGASMQKQAVPATLTTTEKELMNYKKPISEENVPNFNLNVATCRTKVTGDNDVYAAERLTTSNETEQQSQDELKRKIKAIIENSLCMIRKMNKLDPASLTTRDKLFKEKHAARVREFRKLLYGSDIDRNAAVELITSVTAEMPTLSGTVGESIERRAVPKQIQTFRESMEWQAVPRQSQSSRTVEQELAVIDWSYPDGRLPEEKWAMLEEKIMKSLLVEMRRSSNIDIGLFDATHWRNGMKIIKCNNDDALHFLRICISDQGELWPNARFDVFPLSEESMRPLVRVWIPPPIMEDGTILWLIKNQNADCLPENWKIFRSHECVNGNGKILWIEIDFHSWLILRTKNGLIKLGTYILNLELPKTVNKFRSNYDDLNWVQPNNTLH